MSKSVFTNVNTLSQILRVPGSLLYKNPEADQMEEEQELSWMEGQKGSHCLCEKGSRRVTSFQADDEE